MFTIQSRKYNSVRFQTEDEMGIIPFGARRRFARDRLVLAEDIVQLLADEGAEELPLRQRQLRALDQCIEKLPRERRELALAAYAKGTTIREIAVQLGRTEGSLYQLLARIRKELHRCMEQALAGAES